MTARRTYTKPGEPRYSWPAESVLPRLRPDPAPDTAWHGNLVLNPGGHIGGDLRDAGGWVLDIQGNASGGALQLRARVAVRGILLAGFEDRGVTGEFEARWEQGSWPFALTRDGDAWAGSIQGDGWALTVQGAVGSKQGRMRLLAQGAAASQGDQP